MTPLALLAIVTLHWTNPSFQADTTDPGACNAGPDSVHLTRINLYRAWVGGSGMPVYLRSHLNPIAGAPDTAQVPDTPATYFVMAENSKGEGCQRGVTVGLPSVGVAPSVLDNALPALWYDIAGRRLTFFDGWSIDRMRTHPPGSGVMLAKPLGRRLRKVVVIR